MAGKTISYRAHDEAGVCCIPDLAECCIGFKVLTGQGANIDTTIVSNRSRHCKNAVCGVWNVCRAACGHALAEGFVQPGVNADTWPAGVEGEDASR